MNLAKLFAEKHSLVIDYVEFSVCNDEDAVRVVISESQIFDGKGSVQLNVRDKGEWYLAGTNAADDDTLGIALANAVEDIAHHLPHRAEQLRALFKGVE